MNSNTHYKSIGLGDTRVMTSDGVQELKHLENKFFKVKNSDAVWNRAVCKRIISNETIYKITLDNGFEYFAAPDQKFSIIADDEDKNHTVEVKNIIPGNKLKYLVPREWNIDQNNYTYTDGYCIGLLYSSPTQFIKHSLENDCYKTFIWCIRKDSQLQQDILTQWITDIDYAAIRVISQKSEKDEDFVIYTMQSKVFEKHMRKFGLPDASHVKNLDYGLPRVIWSSSDEFRYGFIDAMYSVNGIYQKSNNLCFMSNRSIVVLRDMWDVFGFYGITSTIRLLTDSQVLIFDPITFTDIIQCTDEKKQPEIKKNNSTPIGQKIIVKCEPADEKQDLWNIIVFGDNKNIQYSHCYF